MSDSEIIEAIKRRGATTTCQSCGKVPEAWHIQDGLFALVQVDEGMQQLSDDHAIPTYVVICGNCTYIRLYAKELGDWLQGRTSVN